MNEPPRLNYECPKCKHTRYDVGEIHAAGSVIGKVFDVEGRKFATVTCQRCKYTEFFKVDSDMLSNIFDLFTH